MENFLKMSCKLVFLFDVYFHNIDVINEKVNKLHYWYWYHERYRLNKK